MFSIVKTAVGALRLTALAASLLVVTDAQAQQGSSPAMSAPSAPPGTAQPQPPAAAAPAQAPQVAPAYPPAPPPAPYVTPPMPGYAQQGYTGQPGLPPPQSAWRQQGPSKGLMITGISILGGSYLLATAIGASLIDEDKYDDSEWSGCRYCDDVAPYLFIPIAGPFVAMSQTPDDAGLLLLGMVEVVGAALTVGGIVRYRNTKREAAMQSFSSWKLGGRRELAVDMSSSMRMAGPQMTLRF